MINFKLDPIHNEKALELIQNIEKKKKIKIITKFKPLTSRNKQY